MYCLQFYYFLSAVNRYQVTVEIGLAVAITQNMNATT